MLTNGKNGNLRYQILDEFNKYKYMLTNVNKCFQKLNNIIKCQLLFRILTNNRH